MNTRNVSYLFGVSFGLAGLLGLVPNPLVAQHGLFAVNLAYNLVHVLTGAVFLAAALRYPAKADVFIKAVGIGYVVTIAGFLTSGTMLLGLVRINEADRWLNLGLAVVILAARFTLPHRRPTPARS
jgi:hypothetical protein